MVHELVKVNVNDTSEISNYGNRAIQDHLTYNLITEISSINDIYLDSIHSNWQDKVCWTRCCSRSFQCINIDRMRCAVVIGD